jgi:Flp pilus assembly protein TadG
MLRKPSAPRRGVASVELAILAPLLALLFVIAVDYCRVFYYSLTVANCARNGALHLSDPFSTAKSPYSNVTDAALADAANLSPTPTVTSTSGSDADGPYVEVTVTYPFRTLTNFPGVPDQDISRTVRMGLAQQTPN